MAISPGWTINASIGILIVDYLESNYPFIKCVPGPEVNALKSFRNVLGLDKPVYIPSCTKTNNGRRKSKDLKQKLNMTRPVKTVANKARQLNI